MSKLPKDAHQDTIAARWAVDSDEQHGAVIPPLYMSSNFAFDVVPPDVEVPFDHRHAAVRQVEEALLPTLDDVHHARGLVPRMGSQLRLRRVGTHSQGNHRQRAITW